MAGIGKQRNAKIVFEASTSKMDRTLRTALKTLKTFGRDAKKAIGSAVGKGIKGFAGNMISGMGMGIGGQMFSGISDVVGDVVSLEKSLTRFQIAGDRTGPQMEAFRDQMGKVSSAAGISRDSLLDGASAYVALTGDSEGAGVSMALFAKVANATGAEMSDIAGAAASLRTNMKIDPKEFEAAFSALSVQGKAGAIELKDLARIMSTVAPQFNKFKGGQGAAGLAEMGAALQVLRNDFGSAEESATGMRAMMTAFVQNADKFAKAGVDVFDIGTDGKKHLKGFNAILTSIGNSKLVSDPTALNRAFGNEGASRAYGALVTYNGEYQNLIAKSRDKNAIDRDALIFQNSTPGKLAAMFETLKGAVADAFTPERVAGFVALLEKTLKLAGWVADKIGTVGSWMDRGATGFYDHVLGSEDSGTGEGITKSDNIARYDRVEKFFEGSTDRIHATAVARKAREASDELTRRARADAGDSALSGIVKADGIKQDGSIGSASAGFRAANKSGDAFAVEAATRVLAASINAMLERNNQAIYKKNYEELKVVLSIAGNTLAKGVDDATRARAKTGG